MSRHRIAWAAALLSAACSSRVERANPYDAGGSGPKADGYIEGIVFVQGTDLQGGHAVAITDENGARTDAGLVSEDDGYFISPPMQPGLYRVEVSVPVGNVPVRVDDVAVVPGVTTNLGLLTSLVEPPTGVIIGQV